MTVFNTLLTLHITAGAIALLCGLCASMIKQFGLTHIWHKRFGTGFFFSMLIIFLTALPMSLIKGNLFLLFISLFSFYFAHAGWRYARNHTGEPATRDWLAVGAMSVTGAGMLIYGMYGWFSDGQGNHITLVGFGLIAIAIAIQDGYSFARGFPGKKRIALHATMMLAGLIATVTAFVVTNFSSDPEYILWLAPTILITPYIIYWNIKLGSSKVLKT